MANSDLEVALRLTADSRMLGVGLKQGERGMADFSRKGQQELRQLGRVSDEVRSHFSDMAGSFAKAAGGLYIANKIKPGVAVAGDLQEAMLGVKTELMGSVDSALQMDKALHAMKSTAFDIQKSTPFDQAKIVNLQKELLKGGAKIEQIVGKQGAAAAAAALAAYEGIDAVMAGESLISIATPFNLAGDQFMMLANQAGAAGSASTASFTSIAEGAKYAAGSMAGLGRDSKEMFALLATLDQGGLKGSMGGTSLSAFFREAVKVDAFKDANGDLKSTVDILDTLRKRLDGMGTAKRAGFLQKMFGDEGGRAAQILLRQGAGSYEDMTAQMGKAVGLQEKLAERLKGYNAQLESLRGTAKSTFATMFEPALDPLTKLISKTNEWTGALGEAAMENKRIGQIGTGVAAGVAAGGLLYGGYHLLKGLGSGGKMLGALKGGTELAGGVAMGKALEEAAGVPSVYVVNMPKEFGGTVGTVGKVADAAGDLLNPKTFSKIKTTMALLGGAPLSALPSFGAGAMALSAGAVTTAGAAGYGVGTLISDYLLTNDGPLGSEFGASLGESIGEGVAYLLSPFSEDARAALATNQAAERELLARQDRMADAMRESGALILNNSKGFAQQMQAQAVLIGERIGADNVPAFLAAQPAATGPLAQSPVLPRYLEDGLQHWMQDKVQASGQNPRLNELLTGKAGTLERQLTMAEGALHAPAGPLAQGAAIPVETLTTATRALNQELAQAIRNTPPAPAEMKGEITIRIEGDQRAKVTKLESRGGPDMSVYTGRTGAGR